MSGLVVETSSGPVRGFLDREVPNWRGVPYGRIERRFRPAVPAQRGDLVDATRWGPISWQVPIYSGMSWQVVYPDAVEHEECLNLNIWSPGADGGSRPVLVWLHSGGHVYGSGSSPSMDAWVYAARHDAVIVTANYRLGPWGWLYLGDLDPDYGDSANLPVLDQILLLRWVRDNIAQFGGDPANVTIFGVSSGASDVGTLLGAPAARGLFHKAALYSGNAETPVTRNEAVRRARRFMAEAGSLADTPAALAAVPNVALRHIHRKQLKNDGRVYYGPFVDGEVLPKMPIDAVGDGLMADVPLLVSVVAAEARMYDAFAPDMVDRMYAARSGPDPDAAHDAKVDFLTEKLYFEPAERLLVAAHKVGTPGWWQVFDYVPSNSPIGNNPIFGGRPVHGVDVPALFIDPDGAEGTDVDRAVGAEEQGALMGLARDGRLGWEPWSPAQPTPHRIGP
ncbi:carboxylesterase family protein [Gandjariella thermophila]|uniref:Carboxylic ester hydrolase n=1 Tax=Gandjariella thermophila TaxID=1931992 RepID=A0A4D4JDN5_9PSEU|nr:carboxylesterase family protein [Gandjariella thermophila]GDY32003.1 carboxylesterase [Gandjariella thermophila]